MRRHLPVWMSHTRNVPSLLPETALHPSGVITTATTPNICPSRIRRYLPVWRSHTLSILSPLPDTALLPSGVILTALTQKLKCDNRTLNTMHPFCVPHKYFSKPLSPFM